MRKNAFTLTEIIIVLVVMGILATIGIPAYQNVIEDADAKVCETKLKADAIALEIYITEHDKMPASLSQLPQEEIKLAYERLLKQKDAWKIKLAYFIVGLREKGMAYAASFLNTLARGNIEMITCPRDSSVDPDHGSYGINSILMNMTSQQYRQLSANTFLIGDCDTSTFTDSTQLAERHKHAGIFGTTTDYAIAVDVEEDAWEADEEEGNEQKGGNPGCQQQKKECKDGCKSLTGQARATCEQGCNALSCD